ncbi:MAG: hypothetical protein NVS2B9_02560 [Myxococcales bacterium]
MDKFSRSEGRTVPAEALAASEARFRALLDNIPLPTIIYDVATLRYLAANQAALDVYGYSREEFLAMKVTDIRPPEDVPRLLETLKTLDRRPRKLGIWRHLRKDGAPLEMEITSQDTVERGRVARLVIGVDVTERGRAEKAMRDNEEKLARAQQLARVGSWEWNPDTGETSWSAETCRMLGVAPEVMDSPQGWLSLLHPEDRPRVLEALKAAARGGPFDLEMRFELAFGQLIAHARGELSAAEGGRRFFGTLQDVTERRELERAMREVEERFRVAFQTIPDAMSIGRMEDGINVAVNEGYCRLSGWTEQEALHRTSLALNLWVEPAQRKQLFDKLNQGGEVRDLEVRFRRKSGEEFDALLSSQRFTSGGKAYFLTVTRDITERKHARRAQRAIYRIAEAANTTGNLQEMLRWIHGIVAELMHVPNFYIALYDEAAQTFEFPYYVDEHGDIPVGPEAVGKGVSAYVVRTGKPLVFSDRTAIEALIRAGELVQVGAPSLSWVGVPLVTNRRTVGVLAAQIYSGPVRYSAREKELLQFVSTQVANAIERKQAEQSLRASEQRFRALIESTTDGIFLLAADGAILYSSPSGAQMLGLSAGETPGSLLGHLHPEDVPVVRRTLEGVARTPGEPLQAQARVRRRDGTSVVVDGVFTNLLDDPAVRGIVLNVRDISERKQMEAKLMMADRMVSVGTLAAGVAHEINNPLAYVLANLSFLSNALPPLMQGKDPDVIEALREAHDGAGRVRNIVRDLKTFSRADEVHDAPVDLHRVLDAAANMAWNEIRHRARLVKDYAPQLGLVLGNESRLGQVFLNLIINAAQAIPEGAADRNEIRVTTRAVGDRVLVDVRDTGPGISAEVRGRLFDPFFTTKPVGVGTGLGLFICQNIVRSLGGEISVESEPGMGAVFRVSLPRSLEERVPSPARPPAVAAAQGARVLVVDDETLIGAALRRGLTGHEVISESSAVAALARLRRGERFDLILCDVMMPEMTGARFHELLLAEFPPLAAQVVFMTGGAFTPQARDFFDRVPNQRMEKPLDLHNIRALIQQRLQDR